MVDVSCILLRVKGWYFLSCSYTNTSFTLNCGSSCPQASLWGETADFVQGWSQQMQRCPETSGQYWSVSFSCCIQLLEREDMQFLCFVFHSFCNLLQFHGAARQKSISQLMIFLCHKFPIVSHSFIFNLSCLTLFIQIPSTPLMFNSYATYITA